MNPLVTIDIPTTFSVNLLEKIRRDLESYQPGVEFTFKPTDDICKPRAQSIERRGCDLGGIDGDHEMPAVAILSLDSTRKRNGSD